MVITPTSNGMLHGLDINYDESVTTLLAAEGDTESKHPSVQEEVG